MTDSDPRKSALFILNELNRGDLTLDRLISDHFDSPDRQRLSRRDRNLAYAIIYGVLRWRGRLDWVISRFSRDRIEKIDPVVLNILRIALFQILYLNRVPESAAVNTSVELAKISAPPWVVRFVNGLLRNAIRNINGIEWPDESTDPLLWLSVDQSFPQWLVRRWIDRFGYDETRSLCFFMNSIAPLTLRTNTLKISRDRLTGRLQQASETVTLTDFSPEGVALDGAERAVHELPGFGDGYFQVQDEAAQLVAHVLSPEPGEAILDACAGLGGKTGHIAQLMENRGNILAMDRDIRKLDSLAVEMNRLGISIVSTRRHDLNQGLDPAETLFFDRVLLDAPCSGIGVIRRNPDTKWAVDTETFPRNRALQERFLDNVGQLVRPGGVLVYAVCSFAPEENGEVVSAFLEAHPEFTVDFPAQFNQRFGSLIDKQGFIRSFPHIHNMDGFFIARMKRKS